MYEFHNCTDILKNPSFLKSCTHQKATWMVWLQKLHTTLLLKPCTTPKAEMTTFALRICLKLWISLIVASSKILLQRTMMMKTNGHGIIYNNKVFFVQPMELPCDDTKKFSLESVPEKNPISSLFSRKFSWN